MAKRDRQPIFRTIKGKPVKASDPGFKEALRKALVPADPENNIARIEDMARFLLSENGLPTTWPEVADIKTAPDTFLDDAKKIIQRAEFVRIHMRGGETALAVSEAMFLTDRYWTMLFRAYFEEAAQVGMETGPWAGAKGGAARKGKRLDSTKHIIELRRAGMQIKKIALEVGKEPEAVKKICHRYKDEIKK